jgi:histone acetyltransferase (RNA polymerase elongator complex component)
VKYRRTPREKKNQNYLNFIHAPTNLTQNVFERVRETDKKRERNRKKRERERMEKMESWVICIWQMIFSRSYQISERTTISAAAETLKTLFSYIGPISSKKLDNQHLKNYRQNLRIIRIFWHLCQSCSPRVSQDITLQNHSKTYGTPCIHSARNLKQTAAAAAAG